MSVLVETKRCPICGVKGYVTVRRDSFERWQEGMLAQQAFPELPIEMREMLISGTHPSCWERLFGDEE